MKVRPYYHDAYTVEFETRITERLSLDGRPAVALEQTYFYPTSGGQPHDTGIINGTPVLDVVVRDSDQAILHVMAGETAENERVQAKIDWSRRFDHMQQHSGQHILSAALLQRVEAETVGFHLSGASVTIDINAPELSPEQLRATEQLANEIVWQNRPVSVRLVTLSEAETLPIRTIPAASGGLLRLVEIQDFDLTACGGTHVRNTGEIGVIKILKTERRAGKIRIEFCCGQRALRDYEQSHRLITELAAQLTTGIAETPAAVGKIQNENKQMRSRLKKQEKSLLQLEAQQLSQAAQDKEAEPIIVAVFENREPGQLRALGSALSRQPRTTVLLGSTGTPGQLVFCRAADVEFDMSKILSSTLKRLGSQSGGGSAKFAQGIVPGASREAIESALEEARSLLLGESQDLG